MPETIAQKINSALFGGSPFQDFDPSPYPYDPQGWFADTHVIDRIIDQVRPNLIIEVGTWKGLSALHMTRRALTHGEGASVICVDTWLGSSEHWLNGAWKPMMELRFGRPTLYERFLANVIHAGLQNHIVPLPLPSRLAAVVLSKMGVVAPMIYLDGAHDEPSEREDIAAWWPLVFPGGVLVGDDYGATDWPGVVTAVNSFWSDQAAAIRQKNVIGDKWFAIKNAPPPPGAS